MILSESAAISTKLWQETTEGEASRADAGSGLLGDGWLIDSLARGNSGVPCERRGCGLRAVRVASPLLIWPL